jgi:hypothetical protein
MVACGGEEEDKTADATRRLPLAGSSPGHKFLTHTGTRAPPQLTNHSHTSLSSRAFLEQRAFLKAHHQRPITSVVVSCKKKKTEREREKKFALKSPQKF